MKLKDEDDQNKKMKLFDKYLQNKNQDLYDELYPNQGITVDLQKQLD